MKMAGIDRMFERVQAIHVDVTPRIISDNRPQFIDSDIKEYGSLVGMTPLDRSRFADLVVLAACSERLTLTFRALYKYGARPRARPGHGPGPQFVAPP